MQEGAGQPPASPAPPGGAPQPTPAPGAPGQPGAPQPGGKTSGLAIGALVVGIVSVCLAWIPFLGFVVAAVAVILGAIGLKNINRDPQVGGQGLAVAGLVIGGLMALWGLLYIILFLLGIADFLQALDDMEQENAVVAFSALHSLVR